MTQIIIYVVGCIILAPAIIGILSDSLLVMSLSVLYGALVFLSPSFSSVARRFWREWHRTNYRLTNLLSGK